MKKSTCCSENNDEKDKICSCSPAKKSLSCDCDVIHEDVALSVKKEMVDEDLLFDTADFFKVFADSTRIKIINLLDGGKNLCVCDISYILNMTKSAVSHQLNNLKQMNLVSSFKKGKEVYYSLADRHIKLIFDMAVEHILEAKNEAKRED